MAGQWAFAPPDASATRRVAAELRRTAWAQDKRSAARAAAIPQDRRSPRSAARRVHRASASSDRSTVAETPETPSRDEPVTTTTALVPLAGPLAGMAAGLWGRR
jgi:hypothetical protein